MAQARFGEAKFGAELTETFDYDAAKNVVGVSVEGPEVGAGLGALLNVRSTPGGVVQLSHGPHGESVALTHDVCGRVIERRIDRKGFRPRTWRYAWDALDRLVSCVTPEGENWFYRYDPFGRRLTKVRQFSDTERAWVAKRHPDLVSQADREATVLWTWPQAPNGHAAHDPRAPIVGTHFLWDGDVVAEEAPLRLDGSIDWDEATRWHYEPESFVPVAKQMPDGRLAYIVTDHLGTPREMFDEAGRLRWGASLTTWGVVRRVINPPEPDNDDRRQAIYPRSPSTIGSLALKADLDTAASDCPIRFQGQWTDYETGLYYNRHRYYDPIAAQYASSDPIQIDGGSRPQAYVPRPTIWVDYLGLDASTPAKRGPKTDPTAPHNAKIRDEADKLEKDGWTIVAGGGREKETLIVTPGGKKSGRRPDIIAEKDGKRIGVNVGRTLADGTPVPREVEALDDLNTRGNLPTTFVPYDR